MLWLFGLLARVRLRLNALLVGVATASEVIAGLPRLLVARSHRGIVFWCRDCADRDQQNEYHQQRGDDSAVAIHDDAALSFHRDPFPKVLICEDISAWFEATPLGLPTRR